MISSLDEVQRELATLGRPHTPGDVARVMRGLGLVVTDQSLLEMLESIRRNSTGAGPLEEWLRLEGTSDVVVNGPEQVFLDRGTGLEPIPVRFGDDAEVRRLAVRLAAAAGRRLDDAQPFVDGRLADGTRLHAVLAPVSSPGTCISLRVPARVGLSLDDLAELGSVTAYGARLLRALVLRRVPFLISGGTGSGKTTLLASLLGLVPPEQRVVIVEDARELQPDHPHFVRLEGRPPNAEGAGAITLTQLVRQALRMRPDRIVLGEVRGAELVDLLMALNTGHEGGCATVHANSVTDVPARLEALAALGGLGREACHAQVASALRVAVHVERDEDGRRRVGEVGVFRRGPDGVVSVVRAVSFPGGDPMAGPGAEELGGLVGVAPPTAGSPARRARPT